MCLYPVCKHPIIWENHEYTLCEAVVEETKQTSIFVAVYRYVNLIHIKLCRAVEKNLKRKGRLPSAKQQMTFQKLTFLLLRNQKKEHRREKNPTSLLKLLPVSDGIYSVRVHLLTWCS